MERNQSRNRQPDRRQERERGQADAAICTPDLDMCAVGVCRFGKSVGSTEKRETKHDT